MPNNFFSAFFLKFQGFQCSNLEKGSVRVKEAQRKGPKKHGILRIYRQGAPHTVLEPAITRCPLCENKLHARKTISRGLKGKSAVFNATVKEPYCNNPHCKLYQVPVKPQGLLFFCLPNMVYETDVMFFVEEKRLKDWQYKQIRETLNVKPSISSLS
ncbi:MAG: hypothetical protein KIH08_15610 [Candidatus Freyarchaeota archaeon]|nr:hypothetical protein [Candidatus Jordarchaeia archaeon]